MRAMLTVYRRHLKTCRHRHKGRAYQGCECPVWVDGKLEGREIRKSLDTRDLKAATRKAAEIENPNGKVLRYFVRHCENSRVLTLPGVAADIIDAYRTSRLIGVITWSKELETLRQFFGWCVKRRWATENPAGHVKMPRNIRPAEEVRPYTPEELTRILMAAPQIGRANYERKRALAVVLLLRHTGLRITDVATLRRDRIRPNGRLHLRTQKTGGEVYLPLPGELLGALTDLPFPRGSEPWCPWFFWNGISKTAVVKGITERTLTAVFRKAKIHGGKAHRFRHSLATEILARGGSMQDVADVLGISVKIAEKHYAKWNLARQERIDRLMQGMWPAGGYTAGTRPN